MVTFDIEKFRAERLEMALIEELKKTPFLFWLIKKTKSSFFMKLSGLTIVSKMKNRGIGGSSCLEWEDEIWKNGKFLKKVI